MSFQTSTDFSQTIKDWNALPQFVISAVEIADDCVANFTSLG